MNEPYAVYYCNNLLNFALYYITNMTQTVLETLDRCTKLNTALLCAKWELQLHLALYNKLISILKEYFYFGIFPMFSRDFHNIFKMIGVFFKHSIPFATSILGTQIFALARIYDANGASPMVTPIGYTAPCIFICLFVYNL